MTLASRRRAERSALSNGPIVNPELTIGVMPRLAEPIAERAKLVVAHRPKPGVVDLENLRAKFGRDGDEAFEACALGVGARTAGALQAQMIGQAIGVEAEGEGLPARAPAEALSHSHSSKPRVDNDRLLGDHAAVVGGEKQRHPRDVLAEQRLLDGLTLDDRVNGFLRLVPQASLPIGHHGAGLDRVHANVIRAERARERMGQADDPGLGRGISRHLRRAAPGDRREIDDRAEAQLAHLRMHGLGCEKVMPQIHVLRMVPIVGGDVGDRVALVVGGVVDQDRDRAELRAGFRDRSLQRRDVGHVAVREKAPSRPRPSPPPPVASPSARWRSTKATRA